MTVKLRRFSLISKADKEALFARLKDGYDAPVAGCDTFGEYLDHITEKPGLWGIQVGDEYAGLFALAPVNGHAHYQTTTVLTPAYRGSGINAPLKRAVAEAARDLGLPLAALIRPYNERSIRAMRRAFPDVAPVEMERVVARGPRAGEMDPCLFYDLSSIPRGFVECSFISVYETIALWIRVRTAAYTQA
jgi:GNAT superfamily N-acetyltransferase